MSKTSIYQKKGKLKTSIDEFVEPALKQLIEAKNHENSSPPRREIEEICMLIKKTKEVFENREKWDSELMVNFERIERQIDNEKKDEGEDNEDNINNNIWALVKENLRKQLVNQRVNLSMDGTESNKEALDLHQKSAISEVGEPSNRSNLDGDNSIKLDKYINQLPSQQKDCLYSLGIFPENAKLKKRLLMYWWIGLGLVPLGENKNTTTEQLAETFFSDLVKKCILQPVHTRTHNQAVNCCIINPTIHKQLISACQSRGLPIDVDGKEGTLRFYRDDKSDVRALLNLNQQYLNSEDIITKKVLSENPTIKVVQIGNWSSTELEVRNVVEGTVFEGSKLKDHIEVDKIDFLKKLGERVTFLSLRGISGIKELPDSIGKLENLRILDLRAFHNLENLPRKRQSKSHKILGLVFRRQKWFKNLTYLDISECILLYYMPKWVCELANLEVLKGFVASSVGNEEQRCRLSDLSKLKKLQKLGIKISMHLDPKDFNGLKPLDNLSVLTITWGINEQSRGAQIIMKEAQNQSRHNFSCSEGEEIKEQNNGSGKISTILFPKNLEKLDIRCYPESEASELLNPKELQNLKRLYIRGGKLKKIPRDSNWMVEILRLRYLKYLDLNWYHLSSIFCKLKSVEYEHCTNLTYFPKKMSYWNKETNGPFPSVDYESRIELSIDRRVQLIITRNKMVPLASNKQMIMLELTGSDSINNRSGLDLVAVLDVSRSMQGQKMYRLRLAMEFVIKKLSSIDRLAIVTFSNTAKRKCSLDHVTDSVREELVHLVERLEAGGNTNIADGLKMGLEIINNRNNSTGRAAAIILISDGEQNIDGDAIGIPVGNVAVHTFGFGSGHDPKVLKGIAYNSVGGTFSDVRREENLIEAISVCLAGLLTVVVQDLTLTISSIRKKSMVQRVSAGRYLQSKDDVDGSVTVRFGDLYSREVRKVLVDLLLPTIYNEDTECNVLDITYSYISKEAYFEAKPEVMTVNRMMKVSVDQHQEYPDLIAEVNRQEIVEMIREATVLADKNQLESAQEKIIHAQNILEDMPGKESDAELQELLNIMQSKYIYEEDGRPFAYSFLTSHDLQRTTFRGHDFRKFLQFSTPTMLDFLEQANKFEANLPRIRLMPLDLEHHSKLTTL